MTVGDDGTVTVVLQNTGAGEVHDATVMLRSATGAVAVDGGTTASRYVRAWEPGQTRELTFDARVAPSAGPQSYALDVVVACETPDGNPVSAPALAVGITPDPAAEFGVEVTGGALYVAEQGRLTATVTNEGGRSVRESSSAWTRPRPACGQSNLPSRWVISPLANRSKWHSTWRSGRTRNPATVRSL